MGSASNKQSTAPPPARCFSEITSGWILKRLMRYLHAARCTFEAL
ncbi:hypothetical protein GQ600_24075 [Phytophthora cactorum]|nr:hypothetical protein GQ600_24075 [Phytophthora cactorum]